MTSVDTYIADGPAPSVAPSVVAALDEVTTAAIIAIIAIIPKNNAAVAIFIVMAEWIAGLSVSQNKKDHDYVN